MARKDPTKERYLFRRRLYAGSGRTYVISWDTVGGAWACSCRASTRRVNGTRQCKHIDELGLYSLHPEPKSRCKCPLCQDPRLGPGDLALHMAQEHPAAMTGVQGSNGAGIYRCACGYEARSTDVGSHVLDLEDPAHHFAEARLVAE